MNSKLLDIAVKTLLIGLGIMFISIILTSCNITKAKKTLHTDSVAVTHLDTGSVIKTTTAEKSLGSYERQIFVFAPGKDTTVNHYYYQTIDGKQKEPDYSRLAAIINEKGNYQQEKQTNTVDSSWKHAFDSLRVVVSQSTKQKHEKIFSTGQLIAGAVVLALIIIIILILLYKLKKLSSCLKKLPIQSLVKD